mgnify:CR=1 FL=1
MDLSTLMRFVGFTGLNNKFFNHTKVRIMPTSQSTETLRRSLQLAQSSGRITAIKGARNQQVNNKYADFNDVVEALLPILREFQLGFQQFLGSIRLEGNLHVCAVTTVIYHHCGEWMEYTGEFPLASPPVSKSGSQILNWSQNHGLAYSYAKRYALISAFGLATGDDDDAQRLLGAGAPQQATAQPEQEHWSNFVNREWEDCYAPGTKTMLKDMSEDELRAVWKDHHKTFPPIVGRLADKTSDLMAENDLKWITMEKPPGTPESLFDMDTRQLVQFAAHVKLLVHAKKGGE